VLSIKTIIHSALFTITRSTLRVQTVKGRHPPFAIKVINGRSKKRISNVIISHYRNQSTVLILFYSLGKSYCNIWINSGLGELTGEWLTYASHIDTASATQVPQGSQQFLKQEKDKKYSNHFTQLYNYVRMVSRSLLSTDSIRATFHLFLLNNIMTSLDWCF
jgi:hypothetical protein